jgi:hypothetical protein
MLQTAQRVGSAIGVALVLAQFFSKLASGHDVGAAFTLGLRTTTGFVVAALVVGLADLFGSRRRAESRPEARQPETVGSD